MRILILVFLTVCTLHADTFFVANLSATNTVVVASADYLATLVVLGPHQSARFEAPGNTVHYAAYEPDASSVGTGDLTSDLGWMITESGGMTDMSPPQSGSTTATPVHVDNPVQGMEFVLIAAGFLCGAVVWRLILGRW